MLRIVKEIIFNFSNNKFLYIGEGLTMSEHMIQTAMLAEKSKCSTDLICSSLLHDYGHFVLEDPNQLVSDHIDGNHEAVGANYLKKYLARDKKYFDDLSEASKTSLKLQGGVMSDIETEQFKKNKNYENAIKLRRFDEGAKKQNIKIKDIKDYKELLISKVI